MAASTALAIVTCPGRSTPPTPWTAACRSASRSGAMAPRLSPGADTRCHGDGTHEGHRLMAVPFVTNGSDGVGLEVADQVPVDLGLHPRAVLGVLAGEHLGLLVQPADQVPPVVR